MKQWLDIIINNIKMHLKTQKIKPLFWVYAFIYKFFNRGWRRVCDIKNYEKQHSFYKLPKPGEYDIVVNGKVIYRHWYGGSISDDTYIEDNVTYFKKSKNHKLPRFYIYK